MNRLERQPVVSMALVIVNAGVFLVCMFSRISLYDMGGLDVYSVLVKKEYWRIIGAMFLHSGTSHLFSNMIILFFLGSMIERELGHVKYGLLFFLSGICGNLLSLWVKFATSDMAYSVGASGAVFGLDGALLAMVLFWDRKLLSVNAGRVFAMIVLSVYSGFTSGNIDNAAHIGGLVAGFLIGCVLCFIQRIKHRQEGQLSEEVTN